MKLFMSGILWACVAFAASNHLEAITLSVNFVGGRGAPVNGGATVTGVAGAIPAANWNNAFLQSGSLPAAVDQNGIASASVSWSAGSIYAALPAAPGGGGNADMMNGYLDNFAGQNVTVTGLGSKFVTLGYDILVYFNSDSAGTQGFSATDNALVPHSDTRFGNQAGGAGTNYPLAGPNGFIGSTQTSNTTTFGANYVLLTGFTGDSFTLTGVNGGVGDGRARINGFQIFSQDPPPPPAPEPSTALLCSLALVGSQLVRRRCQRRRDTSRG